MRHLNRSRVFLPKKKRTSFFTELLCLSLFFFFSSLVRLYSLPSFFFFHWSSFKHADVPVNVTLCSNSLYVFCLSFFFLSFCVIFIATWFRVFPVSFFFCCCCCCFYSLYLLINSKIEFVWYCRSLSMAFCFFFLVIFCLCFHPPSELYKQAYIKEKSGCQMYYDKDESCLSLRHEAQPVPCQNASLAFFHPSAGICIVVNK